MTKSNDIEQTSDLDRALDTLEAVSPEDRHELEELMRLPLDWDGEGGQPATEAAVVEAALIIIKSYQLSNYSVKLTSL